MFEGERSGDIPAHLGKGYRPCPRRVTRQAREATTACESASSGSEATSGSGANLEGARFLGCPVRTIAGRPLAELVLDDGLAAMLRSAAQGEAPLPIEDPTTEERPDLDRAGRALGGERSRARRAGPGDTGAFAVGVAVRGVRAALPRPLRPVCRRGGASGQPHGAVRAHQPVLLRFLVGYTALEMAQRDYQAITYPDDLQQNLDDMERIRAGTLLTFHLDKRYRRKDGALVWVHLTVVPLWAPGDAPDYHLAIVENITDRKRAEEELRYCVERWRLAADLVGLATWDSLSLDRRGSRRRQAPRDVLVRRGRARSPWRASSSGFAPTIASASSGGSKGSSTLRVTGVRRRSFDCKDRGERGATSCAARGCSSTAAGPAGCSAPPSTSPSASAPRKPCGRASISVVLADDRRDRRLGARFGWPLGPPLAATRPHFRLREGPSPVDLRDVPRARSSRKIAKR